MRNIIESARRLPSQTGSHPSDTPFERGFHTGRSAIIKRVREALSNGTDIEQLLSELEHVDFSKL
jgi:hypothetical protein